MIEDQYTLIEHSLNSFNNFFTTDSVDILY